MRAGMHLIEWKFSLLNAVCSDAPMAGAKTLQPKRRTKSPRGASNYLLPPPRRAVKGSQAPSQQVRNRFPPLAPCSAAVPTMAAAITDEYSFAGTAGTAMTCTQPFRASLRREGTMTVHSSHVLCRIFGQHLEPATGGRFATPMRSLTYALLPALQLNDQLLSGGVLLYIKPA